MYISIEVACPPPRHECPGINTRHDYGEHWMTRLMVGSRTVGAHRPRPGVGVDGIGRDQTDDRLDVSSSHLPSL